MRTAVYERYRRVGNIKVTAVGSIAGTIMHINNGFCNCNVKSVDESASAMIYFDFRVVEHIDFVFGIEVIAYTLKSIFSAVFDINF